MIILNNLHPLLPNLDDFTAELKKIWDSKWITNNGSYHKQLEAALAEYLKVPYVSLFTNGTLPLMTALQALRITGEVITTPYSFVATTHSIWWNGCKPVFVDIDPATGDMDPNKIEAAITPRTTAIMPVHVYGKPCDTKAIQDIADKYGLKEGHLRCSSCLWCGSPSVRVWLGGIRWQGFGWHPERWRHEHVELSCHQGV